MKYFTHERLARCRSLDEEMVDIAAQEWEAATSAYQERLAAILERLPAAASLIVSRFSLHDARFLGAAFSRSEPLCTLVLQPEGTGEILELNYLPASGQEGGVVITARSDDTPPRNVWVLYDEFDHDEVHGFYTHSLLLSDGREIDVRFSNLSVRVLDELILPTNLSECKKTWDTPQAIP